MLEMEAEFIMKEGNYFYLPRRQCRLNTFKILSFIMSHELLILSHIGQEHRFSGDHSSSHLYLQLALVLSALFCAGASPGAVRTFMLILTR